MYIGKAGVNPPDGANIFSDYFCVLRTLCFRKCSRGQFRKYGKWKPGKGLCPLHSRQLFKKGWTLNLICQPLFPQDNARQSGRFGPAVYIPSIEKILELLAPARVAELPQRLRLNLADPFTGDVELLADLFKRPALAVLQPEPEA